MRRLKKGLPAVPAPPAAGAAPPPAERPPERERVPMQAPVQAPPPERFPVSDGRDRERDRAPPRSSDRDRREPDRVILCVALCWILQRLTFCHEYRSASVTACSVYLCHLLRSGMRLACAILSPCFIIVLFDPHTCRVHQCGPNSALALLSCAKNFRHLRCVRQQVESSHPSTHARTVANAPHRPQDRDRAAVRERDRAREPEKVREPVRERDRENGRDHGRERERDRERDRGSERGSDRKRERDDRERDRAGGSERGTDRKRERERDDDRWSRFCGQCSSSADRLSKTAGFMSCHPEAPRLPMPAQCRLRCHTVQVSEAVAGRGGSKQQRPLQRPKRARLLKPDAATWY